MDQTHMKKFKIFVGVWNTTGDVLETDASPATTLFATDTYRWLPGEHFLLHDVDARFGDQVSRGLEIVAYDDEAKTYGSRSYDDQGTMEDFDVELEGLNWHITGQTTRFNGKFSADAQALTGLWEMRSKQGEWQKWIKLRLKKA